MAKSAEYQIPPIAVLLFLTSNNKDYSRFELSGNDVITMIMVALYTLHFFTVKKAYDTVWRKGMIVKLHKLRLKGKFREIIDDCHIEAESTVYVNGSMSRWVGTKQGVRQGGVLSGFLCSVFINDLLNSLECVNPNFGVYNVKSTNPALADDIHCFCSSWLTKNVQCCISLFMFMAVFSQCSCQQLVHVCLVKI